MENQPQFIKEFSKEESPEERQATAQAIKAKRAEHFTEKQILTGKQEQLSQATIEREQALAEKLESIRNLENKIAELSASGLGRILNYLELKKIRAEFANGQKTYEELLEQQAADTAELQTISEKENTPPAMQEAKEILVNFYQSQKEKWVKSEFTKEDIIENFSEEHLASLSLEDYTLLLKRFPSEMVAHVTRQGIRDHTGHMGHTAGVGVYHDGFEKMVEDGRLRSPLGISLVEGEKAKAIAQYLGLDSFQTKQEALEYLNTIVNRDLQSDPGSYADIMAVHFAAEEVADVYYGSEKGNEIFITYPSAHIASQYYFNGQLNQGAGGQWNDQWVWANEERGIDLNAGIVFLPEAAKVDRQTGSRYELDENKGSIKNSEYKDALIKLIDSANFNDFVIQVKEEFKEDGGFNLEPMRQRLGQEFGITDQRLQSIVLNLKNLDALSFYKEAQTKGTLVEPIDSKIESILKDEGVFYKEATDTISSKEFWEAYFSANPQKRPSKIVYYQGTNPTQVLYEWRQAQGIDKTTKESDLGFAERKVDKSEPSATAGLDRFEAIARKVIDDHFPETPAVESSIPNNDTTPVVSSETPSTGFFER